MQTEVEANRFLLSMLAPPQGPGHARQHFPQRAIDDQPAVLTAGFPARRQTLWSGCFRGGKLGGQLGEDLFQKGRIEHRLDF
jgi:hypothetical protein